MILFALIFGGAIELIQPYVNRGAELADFVADALGVGLGVTIGSTAPVFSQMIARHTQE